jgi:cytochrome c-type biogenesis protein CcmE
MNEKRRAVYFDSDWPEEFGEQILVTYVRQGELDSDAILRAMELYRKDTNYYIKEVSE